MFKDEVKISVQSGKGGDGCISFRREKYIAKGGPDGGDGGKGGDVIFLSDPGVASLGQYHNNQIFAARNGQQGGSSGSTGKSGENLELTVPRGTIIRDGKHGHLLKDLSDSDQPFVFICGGRGGRGNRRFASSTEQVPRRAEKGKQGETRILILELKMIADVGIIGLPNAGKSTLLSRISKATPDVADYPFTTLVPQRGMVEFGYHRVIFADIPGLIEGAHMGQGLGDKFLRHVERTRILVHLIDCQVLEEMGLKQAYSVIVNELESYSATLAAKPQIVAITKADTRPDTPDLEALAKEIQFPVHYISSHSGKGLKALLAAISRELDL